MARVHSILGFLAPVASLQVIWLTVCGGVRKERGRSRTSPAGTAYGVGLRVFTGTVIWFTDLSRTVLEGCAGPASLSVTVASTSNTRKNPFCLFLFDKKAKPKQRRRHLEELTPNKELFN